MPHETGSSTRREFTRNALQSLTTLVLIEGLWSRRLLGDDVRPIVDDWFKELNAISRDVHEHRQKDVEFQASLERLYQRVDLAALLEDAWTSTGSPPARASRPKAPRACRSTSHTWAGCRSSWRLAGRSLRWARAARSSRTATTTWRPASWS